MAPGVLPAESQETNKLSETTTLAPLQRHEEYQYLDLIQVVLDGEFRPDR